jgi:hypothetical protein
MVKNGKIGELELVCQGGKLACDGGFVQVIADADAQTGDKSGIRLGRCGDWALVSPGKRGFNRAKDSIADLAGVLDHGRIPGELVRDKPLVVAQDGEGLPRGMTCDMREHRRHSLSRNLTVFQAQAEKLAGELLGLFAGAHVAGKAERLKR